jgi:hypothetical protein
MATTHKFKVGQNLRLVARRMGGTEQAQLCKVVRLLPLEDGQPQYRVKCTNENVERVVKEFSLSRRDA